MPNNRRVPIALTFAASLAAAPAAASTILYEDGEFFRTWEYLAPVVTRPTATTPFVPEQDPGTAYHNNPTAGGNPGAHVEHVIEDFKWGQRIAHTGIYVGEGGLPEAERPIYDPAVRGALAGVSFRADLRVAYDPADIGGQSTLHFVIRQDDEIFYSRRLLVVGADDWTEFSLLDLTENDFDRNPLRFPAGIPDSFVDQGRHGGPDFSANGRAIQFGYSVASTVSVTPSEGQAIPVGTSFIGVDNWQVSLTPVPVPGALPLLAAGVLGLAWLRRRQRAA